MTSLPDFYSIDLPLYKLHLHKPENVILRFLPPIPNTKLKDFAQNA